MVIESRSKSMESGEKKIKKLADIQFITIFANSLIGIIPI